MDKLKRISFYDNPEALGLIECLRINLEAFLKSLEFIKREGSIDEKHPVWIKERLQKQVELVERLEKLFDKEESDERKNT